MDKLYKNKDWLNNQYWNQEKSARQIGKEQKCSHLTILYWMKKHNISRRTISEANKGKELSETHKKRLSEAMKGKNTGEDNPSWKGGKYKTAEGYIMSLKPEHPSASKKGYVLEHRLVMESFIKDYLAPKEVVHHINEIRDDNRLSNLMIFKNANEYSLYHKRG